MDPPVEHLEFDHLIQALVEAVMDQQTAPAIPDVGYSALSREMSHSGAHTYTVNIQTLTRNIVNNQQPQDT